MEVVRLCLVVAETRRLRPVRPPCGRPLASICGIIRVTVPLCPLTARLRPPCAHGARLHGGKHFPDLPFAPLFGFQSAPRGTRMDTRGIYISGGKPTW